MDRASYLDAVRRETADLAEAATDLDAPCPSCPEWRVADLLTHVGAVHRRFTLIVAGRLTERPEVPGPPQGADLRAWLREGAADLIATLADADEEPSVRTWAGMRPLSWVVRRMAHETAVHRWDGQAATGTPEPLAPLLAVDTVDEFLGEFLPTFAPPFTGGGAICFKATDPEQSWRLDTAAEPPGVGPVAGDEEATLAGPASELALVLWGRRPLSAVSVSGDTAAAGAWFSWLAGVRR